MIQFSAVAKRYPTVTRRCATSPRVGAGELVVVTGTRARQVHPAEGRLGIERATRGSVV